MTQRQDMKKIADHFGLSTQLEKLREEMRECEESSRIYQSNLELNPDPQTMTPDEHIDRATERLHLIEELADVKLMLDQIVYLIHGESDFKKMYQHKIERTLKRIENGYYES